MAIPALISHRMIKTFSKEERLCSKKLIDQLFHSSSSFIVYPFRYVYQPIEDTGTPYPVQVIISVSKRRFKRAHDRNRIKRLTREVYRLQKSEYLYTHLQQSSLNLLLAVQYVGKAELAYDVLFAKMNKGLTQLVNELSS